MTSKKWAEVEGREVMAMKMSPQEEVCRREEGGTQIGIGLLGVMYGYDMLRLGANHSGKAFTLL